MVNPDMNLVCSLRKDLDGWKERVSIGAHQALSAKESSILSCQRLRGDIYHV